MNEMLPSFVPHVLIFPAPGQGHLNSMLKLAEVLCLSGLNHITFCNFEIIHEKLIRCTDIQSRFLSKYPRFQFKTIPDCFSFNDSRSTDPADRLREFLDATKIKSKPVLKKMLVESNPPVTYIIGDMLTGFIHDAAAEVGIPSIQFHTISACAMWIFHSVPDIIAAHQLPIKGEDNLDRVITAVPGMETILRCRDLPKKIVQVDDIRNPNLLMNRNEMREAESLILNTFEELEGPILSEIRTRYPKIYTVGPLHELLIWGHWASYISVVGILSCTPHVLIFPSFVPHVLIFPAPGQGHLNSMLKLAEVLCLSGLNHITFCNFEIIHENLIRCTDIQSRFLSKYPGFHFKTIPDCFSLNDAKPTDPGDWIRQFLDATKVKSKPVLKKLLVESNPPVTYIIGDMLTGFIHDAAAEVGIPSIQFHTISACAMWIFHSVPDIIDAHQLPIKGEEDMDRLITAVPGMESILRCRDLPKKIVQLDDISNPILLMNRNEMREAESLILNTFEELEGPILSKIQTRYPKIYAVGPLQELLNRND